MNEPRAFQRVAGLRLVLREDRKTPFVWEIELACGHGLVEGAVQPTGTLGQMLTRCVYLPVTRARRCRLCVGTTEYVARSGRRRLRRNAAAWFRARRAA